MGTIRVDFCFVFQLVVITLSKSSLWSWSCKHTRTDLNVMELSSPTELHNIRCTNKHLQGWGLCCNEEMQNAAFECILDFHGIIWSCSPTMSRGTQCSTTCSGPHTAWPQASPGMGHPPPPWATCSRAPFLHLLLQVESSALHHWSSEDPSN